MTYLDQKYENILVEKRDGVVVVTLNNPEMINAMTLEMIQELAPVIDSVQRDTEARVFVLTGAGKDFSSGGNVRAMAKPSETRPESSGFFDRPLWNVPTMTAEERLLKLPMFGKRLMLGIYNMDKPTIAAVNGMAAGAGMDISLACDIRIASENARFCQAYVRRGLAPIDGGMFWLPRLVGLSKAYELMYLGNVIDAQEALRIGLVSKVVPHDQLMENTMELAARLAKGPAIAHQLIKYCTRKSLYMEYPESLELSYRAAEVLLQTEDHKESVRAFMEKREYEFKGR